MTQLAFSPRRAALALALMIAATVAPLAVAPQSVLAPAVTAAPSA